MSECPSCGAVGPEPYPSADEIGGFYRSAAEPNEWEVVHYVRLDLKPGALDGPEELADKLTRMNGGPGVLLEVGCAAGWVLDSARKRGWEVTGLEAAPKFAKFARSELKLNVVEDLVGNLAPGSLGPFDVVVMFDVFEHMHDPVRDLRILRSFSRPGTQLVIATPNIVSLVARGWGLRWRQILPSHINYSTPASMSRALEASGWKLNQLSEPRYWDPDPEREQRQKRVEVLKLGARIVLYFSLVGPSRRFPALKRVPPLLTMGRVGWDSFLFRVGDQPVLGDVLLAVASAA